MFTDPACNGFFVALQKRIANAYPGTILETPHDLFHAHLIGYDKNKELISVVHAKEYPADLEIVKNNYQTPAETFTSASPAYAKRNFIYFSRKVPGVKYDIYLLQDKGKCTQVFDRTAVTTVSENLVQQRIANSSALGDVNVFYPSTIVRNKIHRLSYGRR